MKTKGWEIRLAEYLRDVRAGKVVFSRFQCHQLAAGAVHVVTDVRPVFVDVSMESVHDLIAVLTERSLESRVSDVLGPASSIVWAQRGDIVLAEVGTVHALGVCFGLHSFFLSTYPGRLLEALPTARCLKVWRLG